MTPMKRFNLYLPLDTINWLRLRAEALGCSVAEVLRRIIDAARGER